jgi:mannose-6-phosphate isomerase-like protein (cupin superfamily)
MKCSELPNIERLTVSNTDYRRVIETSPTLQMTLNNVRVGEEIPMEVHPYGSQFLRVEKGEVLLFKGIPGAGNFSLDEDIITKWRGNDDSYIWIEPNTRHRIVNPSPVHDLKLYSIYAPPQHGEHVVQRTMFDALREEKG